LPLCIFRRRVLGSVSNISNGVLVQDICFLWGEKLPAKDNLSVPPEVSKASQDPFRDNLESLTKSKPAVFEIKSTPQDRRTVSTSPADLSQVVSRDNSESFEKPKAPIHQVESGSRKSTSVSPGHLRLPKFPFEMMGSHSGDPKSPFFRLKARKIHIIAELPSARLPLPRWKVYLWLSTNPKSILARQKAHTGRLNNLQLRWLSRSWRSLRYLGVEFQAGGGDVFWLGQTRTGH
jgi:hypothetical protein